MAPDQGQGRRGPHAGRSRHSRGYAAFRRQRPLDPGNRGGQGPQARLAFEPERQGQRDRRRDQRQRLCITRNEQDVAKERAQRPTVLGDEKEDQPKNVPARAGRRARPHGAPLPKFVPPSLATLRATAPSGEGWVHEIKFDGYRIQARLDRGKVAIAHAQGPGLDGQISQRRRRRRQASGAHRAH